MWCDREYENQEDQPQYLHQDTEMNQLSFLLNDGIPVYNFNKI